MAKKFILLPDSSIHELGLGTRIYNALFRAGIVTVGQLRSLSLAQLEKVRGLGQTSVCLIYDRLAECIIKG